MLYHLGVVVHGNTKLAYTSSLIFIATPANIFFLTTYSESLYAATTFTALYLWYKHYYLAANPFFMTASATRSNGIINLAFLGVDLLRHLPLLPYPPTDKKPALPPRRRLVYSPPHLLPFIIHCLWTLLGAAAVVVPNLAIQYYGYSKYCQDGGKGEQQGLSPQELSWCHDTIPSIYGFIQSYYWGVGPFKYYQVKQLPNFLLALPVLYLSLNGVMSYAREYYYKHVLPPGQERKRAEGGGRGEDDTTTGGGYYHPSAVGLQVTWLLLTLFAMVMAHIQVGNIGSGSGSTSWMSFAG